LSYTESIDGQLLEEGITEAGSMASFTAAGTSYANRGVPMVPFFIFYSMFGFQRVGDLIWAAADAQAKGFMLGATAGRTTLNGEGLQHQDGHSLLMASTVPTCKAYDPAFAYEMSVIIREGLAHMYGGSDTNGVAGDGESAFYYLTLYNENYVMPARPDGITDQDIMGGLYRWAPAPAGTEPQATVIFSGTANLAAREAAAIMAENYGVGVELWSATSYKQLREDGLRVERRNRLHPHDPPLVPHVSALIEKAPGPVVAVTDYMKAVPDQISRFIPSITRLDKRGRATGRNQHRPFVALGTDGFGRSDTRTSLRRFFEVDAAHITVATLSALASVGTVGQDIVADAITRNGIDPDSIDPRDR
jgi:pyruvate dehydrogenase E1 component